MIANTPESWDQDRARALAAITEIVQDGIPEAGKVIARPGTEIPAEDLAADGDIVFSHAALTPAAQAGVEVAHWLIEPPGHSRLDLGAVAELDSQVGPFMTGTASPAEQAQFAAAWLVARRQRLRMWHLAAEADQADVA
jgi:hypothetical protein